MDKFRIKPGKKVNLAKYNPDDRSASPGTAVADQQALEEFSQKLDKLQDVLYASRHHKLLVVLQGMDTSGKDGTIRHVFNFVDPLGVRVANFKAPTEEELAHNFLWRIQKQTPANGEIVIFNRSHYEDVLITRVHGWIDRKEARRRFKYINNFESLLAENGTTIVKFFLHISRDEQKRRLEERLANPDKRWKFRLGDLEERKSWDAYMAAYEDTLEHTSQDWAPWYVVPANSKANRNLFISGVLVKTLENLKLYYPEPEEDLRGVSVD